MKLLPRLSTRLGFTLLEMIVSLLIVAVLAAMLLQSLASMRAAGQQTRSVNQLRQIGMAMLAYAGEHGGVLPINIAQGTSGRATGTTIGYRLSSGSSIKRLFSSEKWGSNGLGNTDYLPSPDVLYTPFPSIFENRRKGEFYQTSDGRVLVGYIYYYLARNDLANGRVIVPELFNDRLTESGRTPLFSDFVGPMADETHFTSSHCAVLYLDGSVKSFPQEEFRGMRQWGERLQHMAGMAD